MIETQIDINSKEIVLTRKLKLKKKHKDILSELDKVGYLEYRIYEHKEVRKHQKYTQPYIYDLIHMGIIESDHDAWHETYRRKTNDTDNRDED